MGGRIAEQFAICFHSGGSERFGAGQRGKLAVARFYKLVQGLPLALKPANVTETNRSGVPGQDAVKGGTLPAAAAAASPAVVLPSKPAKSVATILAVRGVVPILLRNRFHARLCIAFDALDALDAFDWQKKKYQYCKLLFLQPRSHTLYGSKQVMNTPHETTFPDKQATIPAFKKKIKKKIKKGGGQDRSNASADSSHTRNTL